MKLALLILLSAPLMAQVPGGPAHKFAGGEPRLGSSPVSGQANIILGAEPSRSGSEPDARAMTRQQFTISAIALSAATAADIASSYGRYERNPIVGHGEFGAAMAAKTAAIPAASLLLEWLWIRRHPEHAGLFAKINFVAAGMHGFAATWNWSDR